MNFPWDWWLSIGSSVLTILQFLGLTPRKTTRHVRRERRWSIEIGPMRIKHDAIDDDFQS